MTRKQRDKYLQRKYGLTLKAYNSQLRAQKNGCAICGKHKSLSKVSLAVDHNHRTGMIRGILCFYCNKRQVGRHSLESVTRLYQYFLKYDPNGG